MRTVRHLLLAGALACAAGTALAQASTPSTPSRPSGPSTGTVGDLPEPVSGAGMPATSTLGSGPTDAARGSTSQDAQRLQSYAPPPPNRDLESVVNTGLPGPGTGKQPRRVCPPGLEERSGTCAPPISMGVNGRP